MAGTTAVNTFDKILLNKLTWFLRQQTSEKSRFHLFSVGHGRLQQHATRGFLPGIFSGRAKSIVIRYANFSVVFGPNFRGEVSEWGGGTPDPPVEESQDRQYMDVYFFSHFSGKSEKAYGISLLQP